MRSFAILIALVLSSCIYDAPLTESPTRKIDEQLIGDWISVEEKPSVVQIRKFDDRNFVLIDGGNVYRMFHSDLEGINFLSLQNLETYGDSRGNSRLLITVLSNRIGFVPAPSTKA